MRKIVILAGIMLGFLLSFSLAAQAGDPAPETRLQRSDISRIHFVTSQIDKIHMFVRDNKDEIFRISALSQKDAEKILNQFKNDNSIMIQSSPVDERGYRQVHQWR